MKKVANLDDLQRLALATGARLEVDGQVFNAGGAKVTSPAPRPPQPAVPVAGVPPPVPASSPSITREELAQLVAERDAFWTAEIQRMTKTMMDGFLIASVKPAPHGWRFTPEYERGGLLRHIDATPIEGAC